MTIKITPRMSDVRACAAGITNLVKAMKAKLEKKRRAGSSGWHRPSDCSVDKLADLLVDHVARGDVVDVANFAMMLHARGGAFMALGAAWRKRVTSLSPIVKAEPRPAYAQMPGDITLRQLQVQLPWSVHYHRDFRASPMTHKDFGHALLHVTKACGKLAAVVNDAEHAGSAFKPEEIDRYVADLVVCALRMANTCPGRTIDLQRAVVDRIENKNQAELAGVKQ